MILRGAMVLDRWVSPARLARLARWLCMLSLLGMWAWGEGTLGPLRVAALVVAMTVPLLALPTLRGHLAWAQAASAGAATGLTAVLCALPVAAWRETLVLAVVLVSLPVLIDRPAAPPPATPVWWSDLPPPLSLRRVIAARVVLAAGLALAGLAIAVAGIDVDLAQVLGLAVLAGAVATSSLWRGLLLPAVLAAGAGWCARLGLRVTPTALVAAAGPLALAVAWRHQARAGLALPPRPVVAGVVMAALAPLVAWDAEAVAILVIEAAGLAVVAGLGVPAPQPLPRADAGPALAWARSACRRITSAWRFFACAKLRCDPVFALLADDARPWGRVLDAGCGTGLLAAVAAARGATAYDGLDLDGEKLAAARQVVMAVRPAGAAAAWRVGEARLPADLPVGAYDTVVLLDVLHYWHPHRQAAILTCLVRALAPEGRLILREGIDAGGSRVEAGECLAVATGLNLPGDGLHFPTAAGLEALLTDAGLEVVARIPAGGVNVLIEARRATTVSPDPRSTG